MFHNDDRIGRQILAGIHGRYRQQPRNDSRIGGFILGDLIIEIETGITVNMVVATFAVDGVVAGAAGQMIARLAAVNGIVAAAAVNGHHIRGSRGIDDIVTVVGEITGVAGENTFVRPRVVATAVLRGIAVNHQRRIDATTTGNDDVIAAHHAIGQYGVAAAVNHGDQIIAGTRCTLAGGVDLHPVVTLAQ